MATVNSLLSLGKTIELIKPSLRPSSKSADLIMDKLIWEMKSPIGRGKYVIRDTLRAAAGQPPNIILDLRRSKLHKTKAISDAKKHFAQNRRIKRLIIITGEQILDYMK